jgi:SagB-type dehydrogenase family enzyme
MTRFLSRVWNDPLCGTLNEETERLFTYHQATKHTYQSVRMDAHFLDWKNQPNPFRTYEGARNITLPPGSEFPDIGTFAAIAALMEEIPDGTRRANRNKSGNGEEIQLDLTWLSRLLWHSMAISAWKKVPGSGSRYSLRVNPSSGNLHPTETYVALRGFTGIGDGLYHYRTDTHALELRGPGDATRRLARALGIPGAEESSLIVGLTSIFWREAWKYRARAYRYCCHDLGHAMMSLLLAARALGFSGGAITHFGDARLTRLLGLSGGDEAPMAFLAFPSKNLSAISSSHGDEEFIGAANELSERETPYQILLDIHCATLLSDAAVSQPILAKANAVIAGEQNSTGKSLDAPAFDAPLRAVVRRRRSALDFDPRTAPMGRDHVEQLLDFATRDWPADWRGTFQDSSKKPAKGIDFITLYLYIHRVRDCDPGVYMWERTAGNLKQLYSGNVERVAAYLSLEQALAGNSCFTVSMIADLAKAAQAFGNRGYRYVHFEAGAIGQRLYLGAEALNWNATGIGAFYDDDVHRYLGFLEEGAHTVDASLDAAEHQSMVMLDSPASRHAVTLDTKIRERTSAMPSTTVRPPGDPGTLSHQVIYHFAVGRAVPDPRLEG